MIRVKELAKQYNEKEKNVFELMVNAFYNHDLKKFEDFKEAVVELIDFGNKEINF